MVGVTAKIISEKLGVARATGGSCRYLTAIVRMGMYLTGG